MGLRFGAKLKVLIDVNIHRTHVDLLGTNFNALQFENDSSSSFEFENEINHIAARLGCDEDVISEPPIGLDLMRMLHCRLACPLPFCKDIQSTIRNS